MNTNGANVTNLENLEAYEQAGLQPALRICAIRDYAVANTVNKKWAQPPRQGPFLLQDLAVSYMKIG